MKGDKISVSRMMGNRQTSGMSEGRHLIDRSLFVIHAKDQREMPDV